MEEGGSALGTALTPAELESLRRLIDRRCSAREKEIIQENIKGYVKPMGHRAGESHGLLEAFGVEYRKEAPKAHERAVQAFERSDFLYGYQFFAIDLGFVVTQDYDRRR